MYKLNSGKIKKAVFPCAGLGTRFLPATKSLPKEILPIFDKPAIQYVVEEAIESNLRDIIIVTSRGKQEIENYFDRSLELEQLLRKKKKLELLKNIKEISNLSDVHYIRQKEPLGLGHAILCAERFVHNEPFAVFLPDDIIYAKKSAIMQLIKVFDIFDSPLILVEKVPRNKISSYGIIKMEKVSKNVYSILDVVEKPSYDKAPSNLGIIGRYIFTPKIFDAIRKTSKGKLNEIQITDAVKLLIREGVRFYAVELDGIRYDIGTHFGYLQASIEYALRNKKLRSSLKHYLKNLSGVN